MIGMAFIEFLDLVESKYGYEMVDHILLESKLPHEGAYTGVGIYPFSEMVALVGNLSRRTGTPVPELLLSYGRHIFGKFVQNFGHFFQYIDNAFTFLERIETHVHADLRKLYPMVNFPRFETRRPTENSLELIFHSEWRLTDFAKGLIEATLDHFQEVATISCENVTPDGSSVRCLIEKQQS